MIYFCTQETLEAFWVPDRILDANTEKKTRGLTSFMPFTLGRGEKTLSYTMCVPSGWVIRKKVGEGTWKGRKTTMASCLSHRQESVKNLWPLPFSVSCLLSCQQFWVGVGWARLSSSFIDVEIKAECSWDSQSDSAGECPVTKSPCPEHGWKKNPGKVCVFAAVAPTQPALSLGQAKASEYLLGLRALRHSANSAPERRRNLSPSSTWRPQTDENDTGTTLGLSGPASLK